VKPRSRAAEFRILEARALSQYDEEKRPRMSKTLKERLDNIEQLKKELPAKAQAILPDGAVTLRTISATRSRKVIPRRSA
jgi:hypothetical protein